MKILVFGAGVIGVVYAWQLSEAGQDVTLLVRPGRKQEIERKGIPISCLDTRGQKKHISTVYHPQLVEDFSPADGYDLILVCVKRNQLNGVLPSLAEKAGDADILFMQNNWSGTAEIEQYLSPSRFVLGFPSVGGGRDENGIQCALGSDTMLGEKDGQITPRLEKIAEVIREAGFKPKITRQIVPWLWTHYAEIAALVGAMYKAGSFKALASSSSMLKEALLAAREGLDVCRARGINPMSLSNIRLLYLPMFIIVPFTKRAYQGEVARIVLEGHVAHAGDEMQVIYHEVLADGERLGVKMPHFEGFKEYVERFHTPVAASSGGAL